MADLSDVLNAMVGLATGAIYPLGAPYTEAHGGPPVDTTIYAGWPDGATLDEDLGLKPALAGGAKLLHVSVFARPEEKDTTRWPDSYTETQPDANTYFAAVSGQTVTISGAAPNPQRQQNIAIGIDVRPYVFQANAGETAFQVAAGLLALIQVDIPGASRVGGVITIPTPYRVRFARVGGVGSSLRYLSQQEKGFQVTIWADTDANRTLLAKLVEPAFADEARLVLADGSIAHLKRRSGTNSDKSERQGAYRRDLVYSVEYATTAQVVAPVVVAIPGELDDPNGVAIATTLE